MKNYDWRADISEIDNLNDLDLENMLIFIRHQYLLTAKDLMTSDPDWENFGEDCCEVAENIQSALEVQFFNN